MTITKHSVPPRPPVSWTKNTMPTTSKTPIKMRATQSTTRQFTQAMLARRLGGLYTSYGHAAYLKDGGW